MDDDDDDDDYYYYYYYYHDLTHTYTRGDADKNEEGKRESRLFCLKAVLGSNERDERASVVLVKGSECDKYYICLYK